MTDYLRLDDFGAPGEFGRIGSLNPRRVKSLAIVAAKGDFDASIDVWEVGLYVNPVAGAPAAFPWQSAGPDY